jgi:hypothetical protein
MHVCVICGESFHRTDRALYPGKLHGLLCSECILAAQRDGGLKRRNGQAPWAIENASAEQIVLRPIEFKWEE